MNTRKEPKVTVRLGDRAKDRVTGFEGIVVGITDWLAGCRRVQLLSEQLHDGKPIDVEHFDEPNLEILQSQVHPEPAKEKVELKLGDRAKDSISGYEGLVTSVTYYLSEQAYIGITPEGLKDGKPYPTNSFPSTLVTKIEKQKIKAPSKARTGGDQRTPSRVF